ncbi:MAG: HAMP domain-containing histidine kinase [Euryarchaeota archaeon]|nr:HAMP domain-containing histidine kinase [Euryarchaeota archaeon]
MTEVSTAPLRDPGPRGGKGLIPLLSAAASGTPVKDDVRFSLALLIMGLAVGFGSMIELFIGWMLGPEEHIVHGIGGLGFLALVLVAAMWHMAGLTRRAVSLVSVGLILSGPLLTWDSGQHVLVAPLLPFAGLLVRKVYGGTDGFRRYLLPVWTSVMVVVTMLIVQTFGLGALWTPRILSALVSMGVLAASMFYILDGFHRQMVASHEARERVVRSMHDERMRFLNDAAHELNTPLTTMGVGLYLLEHQMGGPDAARALRKLKKDHDRMTKLVRAFLGATGSGDPEQVDHVALAALVSSAAYAIEPERVKAGIQLSVTTDSGPVVAGDVDALRLALSELLANAIAFTPSGGRIDVTVGKDKGSAFVVVKDTGYGIRREDRERVFQPFQKLHIAEVREEGHGLGLAMTKRIIEAHGGTITFHSDGVGEGTTFHVALPLVMARATRVPTSAVEEVPSRGPDRPFAGRTPAQPVH